jgi:hypothetical protein
MPEKLFERSSRHLKERNEAWRERDRYKQERDDLLQVLFLPTKNREAMFDRMLGADDPKQEPLPRQVGPSQSG